jgi:acyl-coenzyme A thioesterase PaaI-like protein
MRELTAQRLAAENDAILSVEFKINFVSPADGDELLVVAHVVKPGRHLGVTRADVYAIRNEKKKLVAISQQSNMVIANKLNTFDKSEQ